MIVSLRVFGHDVFTLKYVPGSSSPPLETPSKPGDEDDHAQSDPSTNGSGLGGSFDRATVRHFGFT